MFAPQTHQTKTLRFCKNQVGDKFYFQNGELTEKWAVYIPVKHIVLPVLITVCNENQMSITEKNEKVLYDNDNLGEM